MDGNWLQNDKSIKKTSPTNIPRSTFRNGTYNSIDALQCNVIDIYLYNFLNLLFFPWQASNFSEFGFNKITGLRCKTNKTLSFLTMDSLNYELIAEKLGISLRSTSQNTAAIIIDSQVNPIRFELAPNIGKSVCPRKYLTNSWISSFSQDESSYVLKEAVNTLNLIDFVYNYTTNKLPRHLRHDARAKHSHFYNHVNSQSESHHLNGDPKNSTRRFESISISTLSSENFTDFISEPHLVSELNS